MDADDMLDLLNLLGLGRVSPQKGPLIPGWQLVCSGMYRIDLGLQAQRWFAMILIELGQQQNKAVDVMAAFRRIDREFSSSQGILWSRGVVGTGDASATHIAAVPIGGSRSRILGLEYNQERLDDQQV